MFGLGGEFEMNVNVVWFLFICLLSVFCLYFGPRIFLFVCSQSSIFYLYEQNEEEGSFNEKIRMSNDETVDEKEEELGRRKFLALLREKNAVPLTKQDCIPGPILRLEHENKRLDHTSQLETINKRIDEAQEEERKTLRLLKQKGKGMFGLREEKRKGSETKDSNWFTKILKAATPTVDRKDIFMTELPHKEEKPTPKIIHQRSNKISAKQIEIKEDHGMLFPHKYLKRTDILDEVIMNEESSEKNPRSIATTKKLNPRNPREHVPLVDTRWQGRPMPPPRRSSHDHRPKIEPDADKKKTPSCFRIKNLAVDKTKDSIQANGDLSCKNTVTQTKEVVDQDKYADKCETEIAPQVRKRTGSKHSNKCSKSGENNDLKSAINYENKNVCRKFGNVSDVADQLDIYRDINDSYCLNKEDENNYSDDKFIQLCGKNDTGAVSNEPIYTTPRKNRKLDKLCEKKFGSNFDFDSLPEPQFITVRKNLKRTETNDKISKRVSLPCKTGGETPGNDNSYFPKRTRHMSDPSSTPIHDRKVLKVINFVAITTGDSSQMPKPTEKLPPPTKKWSIPSSSSGAKTIDFPQPKSSKCYLTDFSDAILPKETKISPLGESDEEIQVKENFSVIEKLQAIENLTSDPYIQKSEAQEKIMETKKTVEQEDTHFQARRWSFEVNVKPLKFFEPRKNVVKEQFFTGCYYTGDKYSAAAEGTVDLKLAVADNSPQISSWRQRFNQNMKD